MHVAWAHVALAGVWGALASLERRAFLQAMFSRPLVAATGMGLLLGQLQTGLYLGMILSTGLVALAVDVLIAAPLNAGLTAVCLGRCFLNNRRLCGSHLRLLLCGRRCGVLRKGRSAAERNYAGRKQHVNFAVHWHLPLVILPPAGRLARLLA